MIEKMFQAGMNGVRINTAYGNLAQYQTVIETTRIASMTIREHASNAIEILDLKELREFAATSEITAFW
jgi:pyruvate kinase